MAKEKSQENSEIIVKKGLLDKAVDWIVSKLSCFSSAVQDDIGDQLDDLGDAVLLQWYSKKS